MDAPTYEGVVQQPTCFTGCTGEGPQQAAKEWRLERQRTFWLLLRRVQTAEPQEMHHLMHTGKEKRVYNGHVVQN